MNIENLIVNCNGILENMQSAARKELQKLWEDLRTRKDLPTVPAEWLEEGANDTGYFDGLCELRTHIPMGVLFKGSDRYGRMVVVCRGVNNAAEVMVMFDRFKPNTPHTQSVICHQIRYGGAMVDCNGHQAIRMLITLAENIATCQWSTEKYLHENA